MSGGRRETAVQVTPSSAVAAGRPSPVEAKVFENGCPRVGGRVRGMAFTCFVVLASEPPGCQEEPMGYYSTAHAAVVAAASGKRRHLERKWRVVKLVEIGE